jgi:AcrR family transcriptional regulator
MSPLGRPKEFLIDHALQAAIDVFRTKGYEAATVTDLTAAMGIGKQSLYDTFGPKRDLYLRAIRHYADRAAAPLLEALQGPGPPAQRLADALRYWVRAHRDPAANACLMTHTAAGHGPDDPDIAPLLIEHQRRLRDAFDQVISEAQDAGEIATSAHPGCIAALLASLAHGAVVAARCDPEGQVVSDAVDALLCLLTSPAHR